MALTSAAVFHSVHCVLAVYSHGLQASKHDHPDYGDADLDANQKVHKDNWFSRRKRTVLSAAPKENKDQN
jgi:hypothetical protein